MTTCPIDGNKLHIFSKKIELKDGAICASCGKKVGLVYGSSFENKFASTFTISQIENLIHEGKVIDTASIKTKEKQNKIQGKKDKAKKLRDMELANLRELENLRCANLNEWAFLPDDVILKKNEFEFTRSSGTYWDEMRTQTTTVSYGGITGRIRLMKGIYLRAGSFNPTRETVTGLQHIHYGIIVLTNKRLLMIQPDGSVSQITYGTIANIVPHSDGITVMKTRGKNVYIYGDGLDGEKLNIVLTRLITRDFDPHTFIEPTLPDNFGYDEDPKDEIEAASAYIEKMRNKSKNNIEE